MIGFALRLLPLWAWALILAGALATAGGLGWRAGAKSVQGQWDAQRIEQSEQAREIERNAEKVRQRIDDAKDKEVRSIRGRLDAALERLRNRPDRLPEPARAACAGTSGAELSGRDAAFLERLAARADDLRAELKACQDREHGVSK